MSLAYLSGCIEWGTVWFLAGMGVGWFARQKVRRRDDHT